MIKLVAIHVYEPSEHDEWTLRDTDGADSTQETDVAGQWAALEWERIAERLMLGE